ncbi:MAG: DUF488 domain-containing protein [Phycisphaerae bacterium]|jgi:uncharacterized protein (DUF488 family)
MSKTRKAPLVIYTVGHSNRSADELVAMLRGHGVKRIIDVRTIPRSRHNPQFNRDVLARFLRNRRIGYRHFKALGGLRHARKDSPNAGWRNASFRGFADYMQTAPFRLALETLITLARQKPTAIMCAEAVPWRCHRSLIADALTVHGLEVRHITSRTAARRHALSAMAKVSGNRITYPS